MYKAQWKSEEKTLLELKRNSFHGKLFSVSAFKKTGTSAEPGPTSAFSSITSSTPDFPHVQVLHAPVVPKASVVPETKQPPHSAIWGSTGEIPRRLHISTSPKLYVVHLPHRCLRQASPYLLHSKGYRNLLFHSQPIKTPHTHTQTQFPALSFLLQARYLFSPSQPDLPPTPSPICFSNLSFLQPLSPPRFTSS